MSHLRKLSLALLLAAAATTAGAQLQNPMGRGDRHSFSFGQGMSAAQRDQPTIGNNNIGRPLARFGPVTPVPEPSSWALMVAGLGMVGFMVRRHTKR